MALSGFATFGLRVLASSLVNAVTIFFSGEKSRGQNWDIARFNAAQQEKLEDKRQRMQTTQIMMQYLQNQDNQAFQAEQARLSREHQAELERFRQQVQQEINERNLQFQGWKLGKEQELQRELANYNRETQQLIATFQRETTLRQPEVNKLYETWPLRIVPLQILNDQPNGGNPPLKVIIAPPEVDSDKFGATVAGVPKLEKGLAEGLRNFFGKHYPLEHAQRPVEFLGGAWDAKRFHGESSIKALFSMLNSEALLVLESEIDGDYLNMRFAYWAAGQARYSYAPVLTRFPYRESVYESAKARAQKWEKPHDLLLQQGKNPKLLNEVDTHNLEVLRENAQLAEFGVDISQLPLRYKLRTEDFEPLNQFLVLNHSLVAGLLTDVHYLLQHDVPPVLPQWLQAFIAEGVSAALLQPVVDAFRQVLQGLASERSAWAADLSVEFATSLAGLPDKTWAQAALSDSLQYWLNSRGETAISDGLEAKIAAVRAVLTVTFFRLVASEPPAASVSFSLAVPPIWKVTAPSNAPPFSSFLPPNVVLSTMLLSSDFSSVNSAFIAVMSLELLVPFAAWVDRSFMRCTMLVISSIAPSAVCIMETAFWALSIPTFWPLDWACRRVAICRPAASSAALLMRRPVPRRCIAVDSILLVEFSWLCVTREE